MEPLAEAFMVQCRYIRAAAITSGVSSPFLYKLWYACVCPQVVECAAECGVLRALRIEHAPSPGVEVRYAASRGIAASAVLVGRCECL